MFSLIAQRIVIEVVCLKIAPNVDRVKSPYNAVHYNTIMHTSLQWLRQNIDQGLHSQKTPHISPTRAR